MSKSHTSVLDRLTVPAPCSEDWEAMMGNDQVRFCSHCALSVHNLSEMTRGEAKALVKKSQGRLCVRYYRRPDGGVQTVTARLHSIKRRASRIAAGAFSATLSLSASVAAAHTPSITEPSTSNSIQMADWRDGARGIEQSGADGAFAGTVVDVNGAAVVGATVTLIHEETKVEQVGKTNDEGAFQFHSLAAGNYSLKVESPGFKTYQMAGLTLQSGEQRQLAVTLDVGAALAGAVAIVTLVDALVSAAYRDDLDEVKKLLAAGANVNVMDTSNNSTALMEAVDNGNQEMVGLLLDAGANVNARNKEGRTALMMIDEETPVEVISALISAGAKVNVKDESGNSPLLIAARAENVLVVQALLSAGARVNAKNEEGETALMIVAEEDCLEIAVMLLAAGADLNLQNDEGKTALQLAQESDNSDIVKLLEDNGARQ